MKRVFVTGATGFLGGHLVRALSGQFVVGLGRDSLSWQDEYAAVPDVTVFGDLSSLPFLERALAEYEIDTVFHLAAQTQVSVAASDPVGSLEANVRGTWNVLEACRRQKVKRMIVASSDKCYGDGPVPYREEQPLQPHGVYATSKACADFIAQSYIREYGMSIAITRCANLYGPYHTNWSTLIPGTIRSVLRGERPIIRSNGLLKRDYLFIGDAVAGYLALANSDKAGAFNFGTGKSYSAIEAVRTVLDVMDSDLKALIKGGADTEIRDQAVDWTQANALLGWAPEHSLALGLGKTIPWYVKYLGDDR